MAELPEVEAYKREWETFSHEPWEVQLADAAIAALQAESASRDEAVRRALAFIAPGGYDEDLARRVLTDPILYVFAYVADRVLKGAKDKERCGSCKHWSTSLYACKHTPGRGRESFDRCHFDPSRWELCDG
uniref:Uncharacterized protein n=1 Tax=viral metagenome TaxID=1070528 RepID=A0A6M3L6Z4_9ZZZZ